MDKHAEIVTVGGRPFRVVVVQVSDSEYQLHVVHDNGTREGEPVVEEKLRLDPARGLVLDDVDRVVSDMIAVARAVDQSAKVEGNAVRAGIARAIDDACARFGIARSAGPPEPESSHPMVRSVEELHREMGRRIEEEVRRRWPDITPEDRRSLPRAVDLDLVVERVIREAGVTPVWVGRSRYFRWRRVLHDPDELMSRVIGVLHRTAHVTYSSSARANLEDMLFSPEDAVMLADEEVDPPDRLNFVDGVLDLNDLTFDPEGRGTFHHALNARLDPAALAAIREGTYDVTRNAIHRLWRGHFDDENWDYFVSAVGTWLAPRRFRLVAWLVGDPGVGKSTLLSVLTRPIEPLVARVSLSSLTGYTFGLESIIGKQIIVQSERAASILRNIDVLNLVLGENDYVEVQRKHRSAVSVPSMRSAMFSMNDLPLVEERQGTTLRAFIDRLSIITVAVTSEDFRDRARKGVAEEVAQEEALYFLLWARRRLEEEGWAIRRLDEGALTEMLFEGAWALADFWRDCIEEVHGARTAATDLYNAYLAWAAGRGMKPLGRQAFYDLVAQRAQRVAGHGRRSFFLNVRPGPACAGSNAGDQPLNQY